MELLDRLQLSVDLVIVNYSLSGASRLISSLRQTQAHLKTIVLVENTDGPLPLEADEQHLKPRGVYETYKEEWLQKIRKVLLESPQTIDR